MSTRGVSSEAGLAKMAEHPLGCDVDTRADSSASSLWLLTHPQGWLPGEQTTSPRGGEWSHGRIGAEAGWDQGNSAISSLTQEHACRHSFLGTKTELALGSSHQAGSRSDK